MQLIQIVVDFLTRGEIHTQDSETTPEPPVRCIHAGTATGR